MQLSNNFAKPIAKRIKKHRLRVISGGIKLLIIPPASIETKSIPLQIKLITADDEFGILILLAPYASPAANASVETDMTRIILSTR